MKKGLDRLTAERRRWNMSRIRGKDTTPEKAVRSLLHRMGYRFRLHVRIPIMNSPQRRRDAENLKSIFPLCASASLRFQTHV